MSHANGLVRFLDGEVLHFEYDGTNDTACSALKSTYSEIMRDWRRPANHAKCVCGGASEAITLTTDYGLGFSWHGRACRHCMAITEGLMPYDTEGVEIWHGVPEWAKGRSHS